MLINLHVKNLALIEQEEIDFSEGLNIMTGETGAGKSIILGALALALGEKADKSMLRDNDSEALIEAVFSVDDTTCDVLKKMDIEVYDNEVILTRKISAMRSSAKINGESVPAVKLKDIGSLLIDIYSQREHASLLKKSRHLMLLDDYAKESVSTIKDEVLRLYKSWRNLKDKLSESSKDEGEREKEVVFLQHEINEIENAKLKQNEDEALEEEYRRLSHSAKIMEALSSGYRSLSADVLRDALAIALREISQVSEYDEKIQSFVDSLSDADSILNDALRDISSYIDEAEYDGERFDELEKRLDTINRLKDKYGASIDEILVSCEEKKSRLEKLNNYDEYLATIKADLKEAEDKLSEASKRLSDERKAAAKKLCAEVSRELCDLNFLNVVFEMKFDRLSSFSSNGTDDVEFMISLNPGQPVAPLKDVASGGELSRIMLAIKTVLAKSDAADTLVFDEIDAGISGRTAQAVANKLKRISELNQVICITHLPQIASKASRHFMIEKHLENEATVSSIHPLDGDERVEELARMLGGEEITDAVRANARELLKMG